MPIPSSLHTLHYGECDSQVGDLHLPATGMAPVVCLLHGGFWRMPYGREEMSAVAADLASRGYAVWNIEYRRVGAGGGWPQTFDDVKSAIRHLAALATEGAGLDLRRIAVVGHSAGGQLALCAGAQRFATDPSSTRTPLAVGALAGVVDLERAYRLGSGNGAVAAFLGGSPQQYPEVYARASPQRLLPLGVRQLVLHGADDDTLPIELSRDYARAARESGDDIDFVELPHSGHMNFLDPTSKAHQVLCAWLDAILVRASV